MMKITKQVHLLIMFLLTLCSACQFRQNQGPTPQPNYLQDTSALSTVAPTRTPQPVPTSTELHLDITEVPVPTQLSITQEPTNSVQPVATEIPTIEEEPISEIDTEENNHILTAAESANSGANYYRLECISAVGILEGSADKCSCFPSEVEEVQTVFFEGKFEFKNQVDTHYVFDNVAENIYQSDISHEEARIVDTLIFSSNGFERELTYSLQPENCTFHITYMLSPELAPPTPHPITLTNYGFGQKGHLLGFAFIVENPNADLAYEMSQYQITVYDENSVEIGSTTGNLALLFPEQTLGVAGDLSLAEGVRAATIDVQIDNGNLIQADNRDPFQIESTAISVGENYFSLATGIIKNLRREDFTDLNVTAIVYDTSGNIIGGGNKDINFLLANESRGVDVPVISGEDVAYIELYPQTFNRYQAALEETHSSDSRIEVMEIGFGQDAYSASYGFVVENPNSNYAISNSQYYITAYNQDGTVAITDEGIINLLLPNQVLGVGGYLQSSIVDFGEIDQVVVQIQEGLYIESGSYPLFSYENVTYQPAKVTGRILNPYALDDVHDLFVTALVYDEANEIIGGGDSFTYLSELSAIENFDVEVWVVTSGTPTRVELFASTIIRELFE